MDRSTKLKRLMDSKGYSVKDIQKETGIAYTTIKSMIDRNLKNASIDNVIKIAKMLGVTTDYLAKEEKPDNIYEIEGRTKIPLIGSIACGDPILTDENVEYFVEEPTDSLPDGELYYLRAKGESMSPTVPNGALALIRYQEDVESGEIAAVLLNDDSEATLKRVKKQNDTLFLLGDNREYDPIIVNEDYPARIIGKAVKVMFEL